MKGKIKETRTVERRLISWLWSKRVTSTQKICLELQSEN